MASRSAWISRAPAWASRVAFEDKTVEKEDCPKGSSKGSPLNFQLTEHLGAVHHGVQLQTVAI